MMWGRDALVFKEDKCMSKISVEQVGRAFKNWRRRRGAEKLPTPIKLRKQVALLSQQPGGNAACRLLGLSGSQLKQWRSEFVMPVKLSAIGRNQKPSTGKVAKRQSTKSQDLKFVDVTPTNLVLKDGAQFNVEWTRLDGTKMRVAGINARDVAGLSAQFLSSAEVARARQP